MVAASARGWDGIELRQLPTFGEGSRFELYRDGLLQGWAELDFRQGIGVHAVASSVPDWRLLEEAAAEAALDWQEHLPG